ncbi:MAG: DUF4838 domain-containing protein [Verrucomicrobiales bacterium]|nr:DUF4838 domain-containing protein [Verrucomicrobiales bacterium]
MGPRTAATRGVVLYPFDLTLADWPERARRAGLTTLGLHAARRFDVLRDFIQGKEGRHFLRQCERNDLAVEFELHAMGELLSRELHLKDPTLFRVDEHGNRNPDANCCPSSAAALDIIASKAVEWAHLFRPSTNRYFYWPDDGAQWCRCDRCRDFSASEQALQVENHIVRALRAEDRNAMLAHIAYSHTLPAPRRVTPEPGVFLEFAPIQREYAHSIGERAVPTQASAASPDPKTNGGYLDILAANLQVFGADTAQVLEYWLDVSRFSGWRRPAVKLPWNAAVCRADIATYRAMGLQHITTFATFMDADYVKRHGDLQSVLDAYGAALG